MAKTFKEQLLTCWRGLDIILRVIVCFSLKMFLWVPWLLLSLSALIGLTIGYAQSQLWGYTSLQTMAYMKWLWLRAGVESVSGWLWLLPHNFFYLAIGFMILVFLGIGAALPWYNFRLAQAITFLIFAVAVINSVKYVMNEKPWRLD